MWWECLLEGDAKIAKPRLDTMQNAQPSAFMEKFMEDEKKAKERKKKEAFEKNPALQAFLESHPNIDFQY